MSLVNKIRRFLSGSLSNQLMVYSFLFTYALLIGSWSLLYISLQSGLKLQDEEVLKDRFHTISSLLKSENGPSERLSHRVRKEWFERDYERILVRVLDATGHPIVETPQLSAPNAAILDSLQSPQAEMRFNRFQVGTHTYQAGTTRATMAGGDTYQIVMALDRTGEQNLLATLRRFFFYLLLLGGAASLWTGRAIVRLVLNPIRDISMTATRVNSERLNERIDLDGLPREFYELASTMNAMLNRLNESFKRLTAFSEDMAHELRTPVNNLLGSMEVGLSRERTPGQYRNLIGSGIEECDRLKRIIDSLLFIARSADPNQSIVKHHILLSEELKNIASFYSVSAEEKEIDLKLELQGELSILGERTLLQRCVGNLLSNSIRHSPAGSAIILNAERVSDREVRVQITDFGCGIPKSAIQQIGERFFRVEASRSKLYGGTGLGLSITKSIVEMHGGQMHVESNEGIGTTVSLTFEAGLEKKI